VAHIPVYVWTGVNDTSTDFDLDGAGIATDPQDQSWWQNFCAGYVTELDGTIHDPLPINTARGSWATWCQTENLASLGGVFTNNTDPNLRSRFVNEFIALGNNPTWNNTRILYPTYTHEPDPVSPVWTVAPDDSLYTFIGDQCYNSTQTTCTQVQIEHYLDTYVAPPSTYQVAALVISLFIMGSILNRFIFKK